MLFPSDTDPSVAWINVLISYELTLLEFICLNAQIFPDTLNGVGYILFKNPTIKIVTETKYETEYDTECETVIDENIVYRDKECPKSNTVEKKEEYESIFIMDVNQLLINELNEVYFKITDNNTKEVYKANTACLYNLLENYIYKVDLEISGEEVICSVSEDRDIEQSTENNILDFKTKVSPNKVFMKMKPIK